MTYLDVLLNTAVKENRLLGDDRNLVAKVLDVQLGERHSIDGYLNCSLLPVRMNRYRSTLDVVIVEQKSDDGTFSASTGSDEGDRLAGFHLKGQLVEDLDIGTSRVAEVDPLHHNIARDRVVRYPALARAVDLRLLRLVITCLP